MRDSQPNPEEHLFEAALEKPSAAERSAFLDSVCGDNPALRARLEMLLEGHYGAPGFLSQTPQREGTDAREPLAAAELPEQTIDRYKLLERIGEGGFGEVWLAEQREPVRRRVALKIIKLGLDTREVIGRFEAERQALALMEHPNIAKVLDAGSTPTGRPYFVMELVRSIPITEHCDRNSVPTRERLALFTQVCHAVQHAHQKGIIHRDLKPSNVLVALHDGRPTPKIIDFGIAKATQGHLTEKTVFTRFEQFIGTPAYISPEQAEWGEVDVDTRSDIYSLGVLLYELLVGQTPFDTRELVGAGIDNMRRIIRTSDPERPSTRLKALAEEQGSEVARCRHTNPPRLIQLLRGELDWIVLKCLEKDRERRYESAAALAADVERYLVHEPTLARPPNTVYRIRKLVQRNRLLVASAAAVFLVLVLGAGTAFLMQHRANLAYRQRLYSSEIDRASAAWRNGDDSQLASLLDRCPPDLRGWEWSFLRSQLGRWKHSTVVVRERPGMFLHAEIASATGLMVVGIEGVPRVHEFPGGKWLRDLPFVAAAWRGGRFAISPFRAEVASLNLRDGTLQIWNLRTGKASDPAMHHEGALTLGWSNDGELLASGGKGGIVRLWDRATGTEARSLTVSSPALALAFSPDGKTLSVGTDGQVDVFDLETGAVAHPLSMPAGGVDRLRYSPDAGKLAAIGGTESAWFLRLWRLDGEEELVGVRAEAKINDLAFSPDGLRLFLLDVSGTLRLWDLAQGIEVERVRAHSGRGRRLQLLPGGRIATTGTDSIRIWEAPSPSVLRLEGYPDAPRSLAFSPDGRWLAAGGRAKVVLVWDVEGGRPAAVYEGHSGPTSAVAFGPDGRIASAGANASVHLWSPTTREAAWTHTLATADPVYWLAFSPNGRHLFVQSRRDVVTILDTATGEQINTMTGLGETIDGLAVSPDGRLVAICAKVKVSLWLADGSRELWSAPANPDRCAAFSPDGAWLATGEQDGTVRLWEVADGGPKWRSFPTGHTAVYGVHFHPDGRRLLTSGRDGLVKVWNWRDGAELISLPLRPGVTVWHALFSPDGKTIAAASEQGDVVLWRSE